MKLYKITLFIIDLHESGKELIEDGIEGLLSIHNIPMFKKKTEEVDIGKWYDRHILNLLNTPIEEFEKCFK